MLLIYDKQNAGSAEVKRTRSIGGAMFRDSNQKRKKPVLDQVISTNPYELRSESDDTRGLHGQNG